MWNDARFQLLSSAPPNGQTLWLRLLTGPELTNIPGVFSIGEAGLAEALGWSIDGLRESFEEILHEGLAKADWKARFVFIPNAINYNVPESPNVVRSWRLAWDELPECPLKTEAYQVLKPFVEALGKGFAEAFAEACPDPSPKGGRGGSVRLRERAARGAAPDGSSPQKGARKSQVPAPADSQKAESSQHVKGLPEGFAEGFPEGFAEGSADPSPNQEQEQEQEQKKDPIPTLPVGDSADTASEVERESLPEAIDGDIDSGAATAPATAPRSKNEPLPPPVAKTASGGQMGAKSKLESQPRPMPTSEAKQWGAYWLAEFEGLVTKSLGRPVSWDPGRARSALDRVVTKLCPAEYRREPVEWLSRVVPDFVAKAREEPAFYSEFGPKGFEKWLNERKPEAPRRTLPPPRPEEPTSKWESEEQRAELLAEFKAKFSDLCAAKVVP